MSIDLQSILGPLPEVPFKVEVEENSIVKVGIAAIIVVVVCLLIAKLLK